MTEFIPETKPLAAVLSSMAGELTRIRRDIRDTEEAIGQILGFSDPEEVPARIQHMDLVIQELDDIARFCTVTADGLDGGVLVDISAALAAMRLRRLAHAMGVREDAYEADQHGEVELF